MNLPRLWSNNDSEASKYFFRFWSMLELAWNTNLSNRSHLALLYCHKQAFAIIFLAYLSILSVTHLVRHDEEGWIWTQRLESNLQKRAILITILRKDAHKSIDTSFELLIRQTTISCWFIRQTTISCWLYQAICNRSIVYLPNYYFLLIYSPKCIFFD